MRIISGKYKGMRFDPGARFRMRPTTDRNREALFNILASQAALEGILALDLFAGAGGITFEFLSRGAHEVVSVEKNRGLVNFIQSILLKLETKGAEVVNDDVYAYLEYAQGGESFDIVFADPPYADPAILSLPALIFEGGWLKPNGLLIIEHGKGMSWSGQYLPSEQRNYGESTFSFFTAA